MVLPISLPLFSGAKHEYENWFYPCVTRAPASCLLWFNIRMSLTGLRVWSHACQVVNEQ